jgi:hypothetical protein
MKPGLRLALITLTVGGGFTGVVITFQTLFSPRNQSFAESVLLTLFLILFAFVTISGLIFVENPNRVRPLCVALAFQIPWVSSPMFTYKFAAGFQICAARIGDRFYGGFQLGSDFQCNLFQRLPWGIGINIFALIMLILLLSIVLPKNWTGSGDGE